jgi:hypothetical protein
MPHAACIVSCIISVIWYFGGKIPKIYFLNGLHNHILEDKTIKSPREIGWEVIDWIIALSTNVHLCRLLCCSNVSPSNLMSHFHGGFPTTAARWQVKSIGWKLNCPDRHQTAGYPNTKNSLSRMQIWYITTTTDQDFQCNYINVRRALILKYNIHICTSFVFTRWLGQN